jgi:hypothetical protein
MSPPNETPAPNPEGEPKTPARPPAAPASASPAEPQIVDTPGGRFRAQFSSDLPISSSGALVFFAQFLAATGAFDALVADAPLSYASNRAHQPRDILGTLVLGMIGGHFRYAHLSALRGDELAPRLLGLDHIVSEDCVRRALRRIEPQAGAEWLRRHLNQTCHQFMDTKWILDIDVTVKPIYGRQEGAALGYNPQKPGRPSHAYHTYWIATLRLCLDVEVHPGDQSAAGHGFAGLWTLIDQLPAPRRPHLLRGDCAYGQEALLCAAEDRRLHYLCKLRRTTKARDLIAWLGRDTTSRWTDAGQGWQGVAGHLRLQGWSRSRRVIVLRRRLEEKTHPRARRRLEKARENGLFLSAPDAAACEPIVYEHQVLVTDLPYEILTLATLYRERGDAENPFDELKNQWGWSGFTTQALAPCQHAARLGALIYNWWTLYHRLLRPGQHHEAVSTRPRMLTGAARQTEPAGQRRLEVRLSHAEAPRLQQIILMLATWLQELIQTAEQWKSAQRWHQITARILRENFPPSGPEPPLSAAPA